MAGWNECANVVWFDLGGLTKAKEGVSNGVEIEFGRYPLSGVGCWVLGAEGWFQFLPVAF